MPKAAPTQVIVHRIELQETERRLLEQATASWSFRNVSKGVFNLTSDLTTVVVLVIIYEWLTGKKVLSEAFWLALAAGGNILEVLAENWNSYRQSQEYSEDYYERAHSVTGGLRNILDNFIGFFTGEYFERLERAREANEAQEAAREPDYSGSYQGPQPEDAPFNPGY
jgi:hypothetical protein